MNLDPNQLGPRSWLSSKMDGFFRLNPIDPFDQMKIAAASGSLAIGILGTTDGRRWGVGILITMAAIVCILMGAMMAGIVEDIRRHRRAVSLLAAACFEAGLGNGNYLVHNQFNERLLRIWRPGLPRKEFPDELSRFWQGMADWRVVLDLEVSGDTITIFEARDTGDYPTGGVVYDGTISIIRSPRRFKRT